MRSSRKFEGVNPPWRPEPEISASDAERHVREQCPQIEFTTLREYAHGRDNTVFLTDAGWSFRFARREIALPGLQREIDLLPAIAASVPLPIPLPLLHGTFGDPPWPFLCFRFLPGTELVHARLIDRTTVAAEVGQFLAALHAMPTPGRSPGRPVRPRRQRHPRRSCPQRTRRPRGRPRPRGDSDRGGLPPAASRHDGPEPRRPLRTPHPRQRPRPYIGNHRLGGPVPGAAGRRRIRAAAAVSITGAATPSDLVGCPHGNGPNPGQFLPQPSEHERP